MNRWQRNAARGISLAFVCAMALPVLRDADDDGYPLSTYPMFAHARPRVNDVIGVVAVTKGGERVALAPGFVANSEAMLAVATLHRAVAGGPAAMRTLCGGIAARVAAASDAELRGVSRVEITTSRVDAIDFLGGRAPTTSAGAHVNARCKVPRDAATAGDNVSPGAAR